MIRANLGLVHKIARSHLGRGLDFDDLVGEGTLGLIKAVGLFDPAFRVRFCTYAGYWIKQHMRIALIDTTPVVRVPAYVYQLVSVVARAERDGPGAVEQLGLSKIHRRAVDRARHLRRVGPTILEGPDVSPAPDDLAEQADDLAHLPRLLGELGARERDVLHLRYGLDGRPPRTLKEVGHHLGLTRERARQIERKALATLRQRAGGEA